MSIKVGLAYVDEEHMVVHFLRPHALVPEHFWLKRPDEAKMLLADEKFFVFFLEGKSVQARKALFEQEVQRRKQARFRAYRQWEEECRYLKNPYGRQEDMLAEIQTRSVKSA
jgi:hypothetical protein